METIFIEQTIAQQACVDTLVLHNDKLEPIDIRLADFEDLNPHDKSIAIEMLAGEFCGHLDNGYQMMERKLFAENGDPVCVLNGDKIVGVGNVTYHNYDLLCQQLFYAFENSPLPRNLFVSNFEQLLPFQRIERKLVAELDYSIVTKPFRGLGLGTILFEYRLQKIQERKLTDLIFVLTKSPLAGKVDHWGCILEHARAFGYVDPNIFLEQHSLNYSVKPFNFLWGSPQITRLAIRHKFAPIGFSKNLSPLWIKTLEN